MGGVCSAGMHGDKSPTELSFRAMGFVVEQEFRAFPGNGKVQGKSKTAPVEEAVEPGPLSDQSSCFSDKEFQPSTSGRTHSPASKKPHLNQVPSKKSKAGRSRPSTPGKASVTKVSDVGLMFGRASTAGLGKAVEVLDTLSSSMTSLSPSGGFMSGVMTKGTKALILAFEVANTIVKGMNLMQSLSDESMKYLKDVVLRSEGVQHLVSSDINELMSIAAADKRQELKVFSQEVIRFGNRCKDPQWHNLDRYFAKLESEMTPRSGLKETATAEMKQLMALVRQTADLYHELHALDRFELDYRRKLKEEENLVPSQRGDTVQIIRQELKSQKKHVNNLKKKSLWSKNLEEVMEKLVDIVHFLHLEIQDAFGPYDGDGLSNESAERHQRLGSAGLSLHYANIISNIDTIVLRSSVPSQSTRDALYQGLPPNVKSALRTKLQTSTESQEHTIIQIRSLMERTLQWIVPVANNTTRAHHGFGWVGEWANTGNELARNQPCQPDVLKIETLYHADKEKTEACILDLVVWLQCLISHSRPCNASSRSPSKSPIRSPVQPMQEASSAVVRPSSSVVVLTREDREMLQELYMRRRSPGKSKSQELSTSKSILNKNDRLSKSSNHSPASGNGKGLFPLKRRGAPAAPPVVKFDIDRIKALDGIGRVDF